MARKTKKILDGTEEILPDEPLDLPVATEVPPAQEPVHMPEPKPAPAQAPAKAPVKAPEVPARAAVQAPVAPVRKKRVRIRKKTTKHLSVAVLCTNPVTRRFI